MLLSPSQFERDLESQSWLIRSLTSRFTFFKASGYSVLLSSRSEIRIQRRRAPRAIMKPLTELLALLRRHLLPALSHAPTRMAPTTTTAKTEASEQNSAESQQSDSLPEGNQPQSEQLRRQPIPQKHHYASANRGEDRHPCDRRWSYPNQSLEFLLSVVHFSVPHLFVKS